MRHRSARTTSTSRRGVLAVVLLALCAVDTARAQPPELVLRHRQVVPDTAGDENGDFHDVVVEHTFTFRAVADGVSVQRQDGTEACALAGRAEVLEAEGQEDVYACPGTFGALAIRRSDGGLAWADFASSPVGNPHDGWSELRLVDLTGDGRAELVLAGEFEASPTFGMAWRALVLSFEGAAPRTLYAMDDSDRVLGGEARLEHLLGVRDPSDGVAPALLIDVMDGRRRRRTTLIYDATSRTLVPDLSAG